jgi:hypothetical protein
MFSLDSNATRNLPSRSNSRAAASALNSWTLPPNLTAPSRPFPPNQAGSSAAFPSGAAGRYIVFPAGQIGAGSVFPVGQVGLSAVLPPDASRVASEGEPRHHHRRPHQFAPRTATRAGHVVIPVRSASADMQQRGALGTRPARGGHVIIPRRPTETTAGRIQSHS